MKNKFINRFLLAAVSILVCLPAISYPVGQFVNNPIIRGTLDARNATTLLGAVTLADPMNVSSATGITAFATGGQASATALTEEINNITTVATAGDSVKLPACVAGKHEYIKNSGATALDIFPASADSIDALAVNLAVRIQPGSSINLYCKDAIVWESDKDVSLTLLAPTTVKGGLELKAADSAGNTITTIVNASQAAARTYTIPDAGASASFVMNAGASSIAGVKTFSDATDSTTKDTGSIISEGGIGAEKSIVAGLNITALGTTDSTTKDTGTIITDGGLGVEKAIFGGSTITATTSVSSPKTLLKTNLGTTPVGTVTIVEYGDGRNITTELTLTNFIVGALDGAAAAKGIGNIVYAFPAGQHFELVSGLSSIVLTAAGTAVATDTGLGSVIASGVISILSGTATFEDRLTGQTINTAAGGGAAVSALTAATAGIGTGISLNIAASVKNVFLNSAGTWNADNTGNLTATGTVTLKWTKM